MNSRKSLFSRVVHWLPLVLAIAALALNGGPLAKSLERIPAGYSSWGGRAYRSSGDHVDLPRQMVETHLAPNSSLFLVCYNPQAPTSIERSIHLAASWAMSPTPVGIGPAAEVGNANAALADSYSPDPTFGAEDATEAPRFEKECEAGGMALWKRSSKTSEETDDARASFPEPPSPFQEAIGLLPVLILAAAGALLAGWTGALAALLLFSLGMAIPPVTGFRPMPLFVGMVSLLCLLAVHFIPRTDGNRQAKAPFTSTRIFSIALSLLLAVLCAVKALSHTFMAPNGLGVFGGKAKLFYLAGGIPKGFFTDAARSTLQPAYPPGFALLTLGCYGFAGGCGEWITQLLGCLAMAAVLLFLASKCQTKVSVLWMLSAFLTPLLLQVATLYYAEPLMALFLLIGWERLRKEEDDIIGWIMLGASGFFKNEGLVFLLATWFALRILRGSSTASIRSLAIGAALPLLWHVLCRLAGAHLYDFAPLLQPDFGQGTLALAYALKRIFLEPWQYGFAYPAALVAWICTLRKHTRSSLSTALLAALLSLLAFTAIYALSTAPDFAWHLHTAMPRLLWAPALLLLRELIALVPIQNNQAGPFSRI